MPRRAFEASFGRMLVMVLPGTLLLTFILKQVELADLQSAAAFMEAAPREVFREVEMHESRAEPSTQSRAAFVRAEDRCSPAERAMLLVVGEALGGADWAHSAGWGAGADCCEWKGVGCDRRSGAVDSLSLSRQGLRGTLPTELAALASLRTCDLNENSELGGRLPRDLFERRRGALTALYAFGSRVSGTLPASVPLLFQELELSRSRVSGTIPAELGQHTAGALRYVFLEANRLSGTLPSEMGNLRRLKELELSDNRLSGSVPPALLQIPMSHFDVAHNSPTLKGAPVQRPKQGCSGGTDKFLRGGPAPAAGAAAGQAPRTLPTASATPSPTSSWHESRAVGERLSR